MRELLNQSPTLVREWSPDGFQALHLASFFGHAGAARALLERGADPSIVSRHEFVKVMPLHSAVAREGAEDLATVEVLLEGGAPVNAAVEGGHTPLHSAASNGNEALVAALLAHGADRAAPTADGRTPLDMARENGHENVVQLAASHGARAPSSP